MDLAVYCDTIEGEPIDGWRTYAPGDKHYLIDGQEVSEAEFTAAQD